MSWIFAGGTAWWSGSFLGYPSGSSVTPPTYTPSYQFNDTGGTGGGDRNSMYLPTLYAATIPAPSYVGY